VPESDEELDNTDIHPEQYELAKYMIKYDIASDNFEDNKDILIKLYPNASVTTINFIIDSYNNM